MAKARYASLKEQIEMHKLMLKHSDPVGDDPNVRTWHPGHNFATIAALAGDGLEVHHTRKIVDEFDLSITLRRSTDNSLEQRVTTLEKQVAALEKLVSVLSE